MIVSPSPEPEGLYSGTGLHFGLLSGRAEASGQLVVADTESG